MRRLVQNVEREPLARGVDRLLEAALDGQRVGEAVERRRALAAHGLRLAALPVVELDAVAQREPGHQLVAMKRHRGGQLLDPGGRIGCRSAEAIEVEARAVEVEADGLAVGDQALLAERSAQRGERAAQR